MTKPHIYKSNKEWCCYHTAFFGIIGYGETPEEAYQDFIQHFV